ncbi:hypothetical protein B0A50_00441 [Salinomyces thailandicus]|uniref:Uncharacterized protein n=1 Tax=Salinomyces thailandicus TaxID=706561 RepID=A0A4U0UGK3_9PEZI|nr:hypothetical protein B0A50_00441 [Salinomyces thailandica]
MQTDMLALLHHQHQYYTSELGRTHQALSKLFRKLARVERILAEREQRQLSRKDKKKFQWARSIARATVGKLERQQHDLQEYLRQCNELIASYGQPPMSAVTTDGGWHLPQTPWTAHLPPSPWTAPMASPVHPFTPYSPVAANPWMAPAPTMMSSFNANEAVVRQRPRPQYWDLSMLRERRPSPDGSSADSGFHEPAIVGGQLSSVAAEEPSDPDHVYAHELMSTATQPSGSAANLPTPGTERRASGSSERIDNLPDLPSSPTSPTKMGAEATVSGHTRRYSENAIQIIESRLAVPKSQQRGASVGPVSDCKRKSMQSPTTVDLLRSPTVQDENFGPAVQVEG